MAGPSPNQQIVIITAIEDIESQAANQNVAALTSVELIITRIPDENIGGTVFTIDAALSPSPAC